MSAFRKSTLREYFESIVVAVILALFIRTFVVQAFKIPTGSMEQNLLIGDHLLVNKFVLSPTATGAERSILPFTSIKRGDVIVFKYPEDPERDFIKRVIGLPGDVVEVRHKRVYIDGRPLDEPYVYYLRPPSDVASPFGVADLREQYGPVTVPPSEYFVMGDNRDNSQDSRYWGFLPRDLVKGRALVIYWSYESGDDGGYATGDGTVTRRFWSGITRFFTHTRWERFLQPIR